jgi:spermidine synthase
MTFSRRRSGLAAFAFAAGAAVLCAEVVWSRGLLVLLGGSVDATAAVLSAVMAGFALGSGYFGRISAGARPASKLRAAALLAAAFSLLPLALSGPLRSAWPAILSSGAPPALARAAAGFFAVFPACFFAGGMLPLLAAISEADGEGAGRISGLYALNTSGSALGGLLAGFVLLELAGAWATLIVSASVLAASALLVRAPERGSREPVASGRPGRTILLLYALSGAIALAWECVWARQLTFLLGNSTYAFCTMSSAALAGMAAGAALGRNLGRRAHPLAVFGAVEACLAATALLPLACTSFLPGLMQTVGPQGRLLRDVAWNGLALLSMIPASMCMGATFPAAVRAAARPGKLGPDVGRLTMANGIGAAIGPFLATRALFPLAGVTSSSALLAAGGAGISLAAALSSPGRRTAFLALVPAAIAASSLLSSIQPGSRAAGGDLRLLFFDEDRTATVAVFGRDWDGYLSLRINGVEEVPIDQASLEAFYLLGHLPWGYNPSARSALVIAYGGGTTAGALLSHPLDTLVCVELCPAVAGASQLFSEYNGRPDLDPRFSLVEDDGRNYVAGSSADYDLIVCDATHPGSADSWVLYTREFYEDVLARLSPGGVAAQWVPLHSLPTRDFAAILNTWSSVFPHCSVHLAGGRHAILAGSASPLALRPGAMFDTPEASRALASVGYSLDEPAQLMPVAVDSAIRRADISASGANTDDLSPCQFIRRRAPRDSQATISPDASLALSLEGLAGEFFSGQLLYWQGDLPGAVSAFRLAGDSPLARRWLAVSLTSAAEQISAAGTGAEAIPLLEEAIEADSSWPRAARLAAMIRQGPPSATTGD